MDKKENLEEKINESIAGENSAAQGFQTPEVRRYVDRSGEVDTDVGEIAEGAVWHGPAFDASDADAEKMRVRSIIEKNVQGFSAEAEANYTQEYDESERPAEEPDEPKRESFVKSTWFAILFAVIFPPVGIALLWKNKKFSKGVRIVLTVLSAALFILALFAGYRSFRRYEDAKIRAQAEALLAQQKAEQEENAQTSYDEDEVRRTQLPHSSAYPTPTEFFTSKTAFTDYQYYYLYSQGIVSGYESYQGTDILTVMTKYGYLKLLGTTFTIPELEVGDVFYFYYLYLGYDTTNDAVFGTYVDCTVEDEGAGKEQFASHADGTYLIGTDIPAGEYFFYPTDATGSINVFGDDKFIEKIYGEDFEGGCFVTVEDGQYLVVKGAQFALSDTIALSSGNTLYPSVYRIGIDIEPGTYRLSIDGTGPASYIIYDGSDPKTRQILDTAQFDKQVIITAEEGQYLQLINCTGAVYSGTVTENDGSGTDAPDEEAETDTEA